jgi:hypothetical protein
MKIMFLDESGDHNLEIIDPQYPVFVLAGVIVGWDYAQREMEDRFAAFKQDVFGRTDIILHTADILRNRNGFEQVKDRAFRDRFFEKLNTLVRTLDFKVVACAIRKQEHLARYNVAALDPYMLSLNVLVERFCFEIGDVRDGGLMVAERRNSTLDQQLELAFLNLKIQGTKFMPAVKVGKRISALNMRRKAANIAGLQLADLVASPIGRHVLGRKTHEDYRIVESKMRRDHYGRHAGHGLVVLPR